MTDLQSYRNLRSRLRTGDVVLYSGSGLVSWLIKKGQALSHPDEAAQWSHSGIVLRLGDTVMVFEANGYSEKDDSPGAVQEGVSCMSLSDRILRYEGSVAIRCLTDTYPSEAYAMVEQRMKQFRGVAYERDYSELMLSAFGQSSGEDLTNLFCSELVAECLEPLGVLPIRPSNSFSPAHLGGSTLHPADDPVWVKRVDDDGPALKKK